MYKDRFTRHEGTLWILLIALLANETGSKLKMKYIIFVNQYFAVFQLLPFFPSYYHLCISRQGYLCNIHIKQVLMAEW